MHYLDDLSLHTVPSSQETQAEVKEKVNDKFQHINLSANLNEAFKIWDAVSSIFTKQAMLGSRTNSSSSFTKARRQLEKW